MAPKAMKRPAAAAADAPAKLAKTIAGFSKKIDAVIEAIDYAEESPESTKKMLKAGLPHSIEPPKDQRHPNQVKVIGWVQEALAAVEADMKKAIVEAEADLSSKTAKKDECQVAQDAAKAAYDGKCEAILGKKTALSDAETALKEAKVELKDTETAQAEGDKGLVEIEANKSKHDEAMGNFLKLKAGGVPPEEVNDLVKKAGQMGTEMALDQSMLKSLPSALEKSPDARGNFDNVVVASFEEELKKRIDKLTQDLADGQPAKDERAAKVEAANTKVQTCTSTVETCKEELSTANAEKDAASTASKDAITATKSALSDVKAATSSLSEAKKSLAQLEKGALADFKELDEWDGKPKASQYKYMGGIRYERDLLEMAGEEEITMEKAGALFDKAMDGNIVTPTEKRTLRYILKNKGFVGDAKNFLETKMGSSWYQSIDGVQYERTLLTIATSESVPLGMDAVEKLWNSAQDRNTVTACEKLTLEYIAGKFEFSADAKADLTEKIASLEVEEGTE